MRARKNNSKKLTVVLLSIILVLCCTIGGTLAWLSATSGTVTNTFTVGDITIDLKEHELGDGGALTTEEVTAEDEYKILPGTSQPKDPFVRIGANSENCYVFVQVKEVNNTVGNTNEKYIEWAIANGWTQLGNTTNGVSTYYRTTNYATAAIPTTYDVLANNSVSYGPDLTKEDIALLYGENGTLEDGEKPQLIFKAFAVQSEGLTKADGTAITSASDAWDLIDSSAKLS